MRPTHPVMLAITLVAGCSHPPAPPPANSTPPPVSPARSTAAPAPHDGSLCHLAQGVTPRDPGRVCDPCARPGPFHFEEAGFMTGTMELDVDAQGTGTWTKQEMRPGAPRRTWRAPLSRDQVASLERAMATGRVCGQRSRRSGIPDEATVLIDACFPTARCEVMLWDGEWSDRPEAKAALGVVDAIIDDVVKRGAPAGR